MPPVWGASLQGAHCVQEGENNNNNNNNRLQHELPFPLVLSKQTKLRDARDEKGVAFHFSPSASSYDAKRYRAIIDDLTKRLTNQHSLYSEVPNSKTQLRHSPEVPLTETPQNVDVST